MAMALGIDIGKRSVRAALVRISARKVEVERYLEVPIHVVSTDRAEHMRAAYAAAGELVRGLPVFPDTVVTQLDGLRASLREVSIPVATRKRALEVLPFELEGLLPFSLDEVVLDFQEVGTQGGELTLLCATAREASVAEVLEGFEAQGVTIHELAVGAPALDGLLAELSPPPDETTVLIDIAEDSTDLCFVHSGATRFGRTLDVGASSMRAQPNALRAALQQTVVKYRSEGGPRATRAYVSGDAADDRVLTSWLSESLGVQVETFAPPPATGSLSPSPPAPSMARAFALAARTARRGKRLNLRTGKFALARRADELRAYALLGVMCLLGVIVSYGFSVWAEYKSLTEQRDTLAEELHQVTEQYFRVGTKSPKSARELLEGGGKKADPLPHFDAFNTLAVLSGAVSPAIKHDARRVEIQLDEVGQAGKFEIQGLLADLSERDTIVTALDAHDCIGEIEPGKIQSVPGEDRKSYTLEGQIACPGTVPEGKDKSKAKKGARSKP